MGEARTSLFFPITLTPSFFSTNTPPQFVIPQEHFMMKEIRILPSIAYNDEDFKETVEAFSAGM